ncbi:3-deoxy-7-phosphoheptulonate synthase [uncultured Fretibacterium sp.]|uniref:3-deoxy-7-phosphoheptulonate synthase n=1 Tax=uncultured Fretibacterium sp. TaxID=1678694 RepID=UPI00260942C9|nr:3-deoxy-7-phosphoheptulonate synthase [uncultured Fretibacterium sp.]
MIIILKKDPDPAQLESLVAWLREKGLQVHTSTGESHIVLGLVGDTASMDIDLIAALDIVESVRRVQEPYKKANRKFHPKDTIIEVAGRQIGGGTLTIMAGPCSVESEEQILAVAQAVKESGATMLRGGAFKPRTSPYSFQGKGVEGLRLLSLAKKATGLPIVTELMEVHQLEYFDDVDVIQVGARNMQNFNLLKELGKQDKPILLKRGMSGTIEELLMSAEYVMSEGNEKVILCERGIRTFETATRNTLDLSAIPVLRQQSHLPIIVDPSHATGKANLVPPMALAAVAAGADGLIIEVHNDPQHALCDGSQSLRPEVFDRLAKQLKALHTAVQDMERTA